MSTDIKRRRLNWGLVAAILAYLVAGVLYAALTPAWQVPDEPAHYNYIRYVARHGRFPVLKRGDYPAEYLEEIKSRKFPSGMSIDPIRYEFHQPPLYYLLEVPVFLAFGGRILPLRLFSVFLGAVLLVLIYRVLLDLFPRRRWIALTAASFVAVLPMHTAMMAGVDNDSLAEVLLAVAVCLSLRLVLDVKPPTRRSLARLGVVLGLILVTKTTAYVAVAIAVLAVAMAGWGRWGAWKWADGYASVLAPAALISAPWYFRDVLVYGWPDFLGLRRHGSVVIGQPRTPDWIQKFGWHSYLHRYFAFTFDSFWGVFGWLSAFMDQRIYLFLEVLSVTVFVGLLSAMWKAFIRHDLELSRGQKAGIVLLVLLFLGVLAEYVGYNLLFVQHQGRYLFPALIAISAGWAVGLRQAFRGRTSVAVSALAFGFALFQTAYPGGLGKWGVFFTASLGMFFLLIGLLGKKYRWIEWIGVLTVHAVLYLIGMLALFGLVLVQLAV